MGDNRVVQCVVVNLGKRRRGNGAYITVENHRYPMLTRGQGGADVYISVPIHIRFVAESRKDKSFLSPCTDPISASISVNFSRNYEGFDVWFRDFEQRLLDAGIGARTHLGKIHFQPPEIPPEFMAVRDALDPEGLFKNFGNVYEG